MVIRAYRPDDIAALARIYDHYVLQGLGTFEESPPGESVLAGRLDELVKARFPVFVAEEAGQVVGFAYAGPYRPRTAYRFTVEDSVYVAPDALRCGVGGALLGALIAAATAMGKRQMIAVIGDVGNTASIALHRKAGFAEAGHLTAVGFKLGRWLDVVVMQRALPVE